MTISVVLALCGCDDSSTEVVWPVDIAVPVGAVPDTGPSDVSLRLDVAPKDAASALDGPADAELADAGPADAAYVLPDSCVDIWINHTTFDEPDRWRGFWPFTAIKPFIVDERGVHVAFHILEYGGDPFSLSSEDGQFALLTFDKVTGEKITERLFDVFPPNFGATQRAVYDFDIAPDGTFAALIAWGSLNTRPVFEVAIGHLDTPGPLIRTRLGWDDVDGIAHQMAWDGEAFSVHGFGGPGWLMARVSKAGELLAERVEVGMLYLRPDEEKSYANDPVTGTTFNINIRQRGSGVENITFELSGHARDGSPLPDLPRGGRSVGPLLSPDSPEVYHANRVLGPKAVAVSGELFLATGLEWRDSPEARRGSGREVILRVGVDWTVKDWRVLAPLAPQTRYGGRWIVRAAAQPDRRWPSILTYAKPHLALTLVPEADSNRAYRVLHDRACGLRGGCLGGWQITAVTGQTYQDSTWVGLVERSGAAFGALQDDPLLTRYRIVKASPECDYPSIRDTLGLTPD